MLTTSLLTLTILSSLFLWASYKDSVLKLAPVKGFLFGVHYNLQEGEDEWEGNKYHTLQVCLFFVILTFEWDEVMD